MADDTVLVVGGTGRTGGRVVQQLLGRGVRARAIVRSAERLPACVRGAPGLSVIETDLLSASDEDLRRHADGCAAVISCLGHTLNAKGIFGRPRDLVTRATTRLCQAVEALRPARPVKLILMSSVSVNRPGSREARRGSGEKAFLWVLRAVLPPAKDNQRAADFLHDSVGAANPFVQWVVVRPDTLLDGDVCEYELHDELVSSLRAPASTNMANVAHFICELATDRGVWERWAGKLPVIVNAPMAKA